MANLVIQTLARELVKSGAVANLLEEKTIVISTVDRSLFSDESEE
ncbi:hypothetical protein [Vibrio agarivorans]|nr:hypothetical protein [Vibrio agarivorans]